ncbi:hypothetical protein, partial [Stenotrophomonas maltophilia group sp. RNC7]|uniref:hypothetical protein n=1 Tax=Stenotrophomonas maltophilia group sp. RNC7 TaxID=3071467 RepID=UPI0027E1376A
MRWREGKPVNIALKVVFNPDPLSGGSFPRVNIFSSPHSILNLLCPAPKPNCRTQRMFLSYKMKVDL